MAFGVKLRFKCSLYHTVSLSFLISKIRLNTNGAQESARSLDQLSEDRHLPHLLFKLGPIPCTGWFGGRRPCLYGLLPVLNSSLTLGARVVSTKVKHQLVFKKGNVYAASASIIRKNNR